MSEIICHRESRVGATWQMYEMGILMTWTSSDFGMGFIIIFGKILGGEGLLCLMLVCTNLRTPYNLKFSLHVMYITYNGTHIVKCILKSHVTNDIFFRCH